MLRFGVIESEPVSGNPSEAFIEIVNERETAIDISGWKLEGAVAFTFPEGTVISGNAYAPMNTVFLSPDVGSFRHRGTSPTGGEGHFVVGNYGGSLSPSGGEVNLLDDTGNRILEKTTGQE